jgi:hypothetical protein
MNGWKYNENNENEILCLLHVYMNHSVLFIYS